MPDRTLPLLVTHSGKFHCDEVFAYAVLRLALGLSEPGSHRLVRTRDPAIVTSADFAWDVGGVYDEAANRFDHHQRGAPLRADGMPFSSAGLVWRRYGVQAVRALLPAGTVQDLAPAIAATIDAAFVRRIDELDNGMAPEVDTLGLASLIADFNPSWDALGGDEAADAAFLDAVTLAEDVLRRRVESLRASLAAEAILLAAHAASFDPRILVLDQGMPWKTAVFAHNLPVAFAVYPASNGNWMVDSMPPEEGSFEQRIPLPASWAGLSEAELGDVSGVADAVFTHLRRFVGAAKTRAGAIAMAQKAIELSGG
ncbi:MAG: MYG1 family protein [Beijerinckiaceae bacterium]|jgi:uncharacterized UPF0160 family protein